MLNELWWAVPEKLAGMRKPTSVAEVNSLKPQIAAIISLLDDEENHELYQESHMPFLWLPVAGGKTLSEEQVAQARSYYTEITQAKEATQSQLAKKTDSMQTKAIAIHCSGGKKRTATAIAAILTEHMTGDQALTVISQANPEIMLNDTQLEFVKSLA